MTKQDEIEYYLDQYREIQRCFIYKNADSVESHIEFKSQCAILSQKLTDIIKNECFVFNSPGYLSRIYMYVSVERNCLRYIGENFNGRYEPVLSKRARPILDCKGMG